jgi:serine/threonine protein kinase
MGIVYKAEQVNLGRFVALKVLYPHLVNDPITIKRFNHEARATALLNHPNIVQIFDVGAEEDRHYFAMEYVPGTTLQAVLESRGKLGIEETLRIADQVASALSAAHNVGIVHRDVKPSNILLDDRGKVKVSDFGIAVAAGRGDLTDAEHLVGTARYMSPEHVQAEDLDGRSDLYSLGIVMYEMLSGSTPFDAETPLAVLQSHVSLEPGPLSGEIPPLVQALVMKCLAKRKVDRHRTVKDFRVALREATAEVEWEGPALSPLEAGEPELEPDRSFRYDRAGVLRSVTDTISLGLAERLRPKKGFRGRVGRVLSDFIDRRLRSRRDSYKMKRVEVMELRENLRRAEQQLEEAKSECDHTHEKYEAADEELHGWQMEGSLSLEKGKRVSKESAAVQERKLWQQATAYKLQWQSLQDRVRDWYQNVERARRDCEAAVKDLELLRLRRLRTAQDSKVSRRNRMRVILLVTLVIGGFGLWLLDRKVFRSAHVGASRRTSVYGKFVTTGLMQAARDEHAAALLDSGRVLLAGGIDAEHRALVSAEIFESDVHGRVFSPTGPMSQARFNHTMTNLGGGRGVLVAGGEQHYGRADALRSVEIFSESDGLFAEVSRLVTPRTRHRAERLKDGAVLVTGGKNDRGETLNTAEVFEATTNTFGLTGWMRSARKDHATTLLEDGRVLVTGGSQSDDRPLAGVEVFDPQTKRFEEICRLNQPRYEHTATLIDRNRVLVIGGRRGQSLEDSLDSIEMIDVEAGSAAIVGRLRLPRRVHTTTLLPDGTSNCVLIAGGAVGMPGDSNMCERFVLGWRETGEAGRLNHDRNNQTATLLADGSILFAGGYGRNVGQPLRVAELYVKVPAPLEQLPSPPASPDDR